MFEWRNLLLADRWKMANRRTGSRLGPAGAKSQSAGRLRLPVSAQSGGSSNRSPSPPPRSSRLHCFLWWLPAEITLVAQHRSLLARIHPAIPFALRSIRRSMTRPGSRCPVPVAISQSGLPPPTGRRVWGCAICRWPSPVPVCSDARLVPERSPRLGRLALALALVGPARHRLWRRCSSHVRVWAFPPFAGERKRSQTLTSKEETHHG